MEECLEYLKITYLGFEDYQYEVAAGIGGVHNFKNMDRQLVGMAHEPYIAKIGKTNHQLFLDRVGAYFMNCERMKNNLI